jgi:hypothetical protein
MRKFRNARGSACFTAFSRTQVGDLHARSKTCGALVMSMITSLALYSVGDASFPCFDTFLWQPCKKRDGSPVLLVSWFLLSLSVSASFLLPQDAFSAPKLSFASESFFIPRVSSSFMMCLIVVDRVSVSFASFVCYSRKSRHVTHHYTSRKFLDCVNL